MNKEAVFTKTSTSFAPKDVEQFVFLYEFVNFDTQALEVWKEKTQHEEMRDFAQKQLKISSSFKALLESVASDNGIKLPIKLPQNYERELYKYSASSRKGFEKVFLQNYLEMCKNFNDSLSPILESVDAAAEIKHLSTESYNNVRSRIIQVAELHEDARGN